MDKKFCDVCGAECDFAWGALTLIHQMETPREEKKDLCFDCRREVVKFIENDCKQHPHKEHQVLDDKEW